MTITIDSIWILLGIACVLGFGGYLGVTGRFTSFWPAKILGFG